MEGYHPGECDDGRHRRIRFQDRSKLWALLKESSASGTALVTQVDQIGAAGESGGRGFRVSVEASRTALKPQLASSKPGEIKAKYMETLRQAGAVVDAKAPNRMRQPSKAGWPGWLRRVATGRGPVAGRGGVRVSEAGNAHGDFKCTETEPGPDASASA